MENKEKMEMYEEKDYIKVIKNTKGYNWEIKIVAKPNTNLLDQISFVNDEMVKKFGNPSNGFIDKELKEGEIKK